MTLILWHFNVASAEYQRPKLSILLKRDIMWCDKWLLNHRIIVELVYLCLSVFEEKPALFQPIAPNVEIALNVNRLIKSSIMSVRYIASVQIHFVMYPLIYLSLISNQIISNVTWIDCLFAPTIHPYVIWIVHHTRRACMGLSALYQKNIYLYQWLLST